MKFRNRVVLTVILLLAGNASAYKEWVGIPDPETGAASWDVAANWSETVTPGEPNVPTNADEVRFNDDYAMCLIDSATDAECLEFKMGDNGGNDLVHQLMLKGSLTTFTSGWSAVGYNRAARMYVERGASLSSSSRVGVGLVATANTQGVPSTLNVNGGSVTVGGNLQIGYVGGANHKGVVNVNSGTLVVNQDLSFRDTGTPATWSFMDISHGTVIVDGDETTLVGNLISSGALTGFGGAGTVNTVFADGVTTITADDPLDRTPEMDTVVPAGDVDLSWVNVGMSPVYVAVYYDNGLGLENLTRVTDPNTAIDVTTTTVAAPTTGEYIWRVDTYESAPGADPNDPIVGDTMYFIASDDQPPQVAMDTVPTATWINKPVQLNITVTDDGESPVTFLWESSDPNAVFIPNNTVEDPEVACDYAAGQFTVTVTASDGNPLNLTGSASVAINCAENACEAARGPLGLAGGYPGDIVIDCMVDLTDLAVIAGEWATDYTITAPEPDNR